MATTPINHNESNTDEATPSVAIVHDWLYGGGAEKVVLELHKLYPDAPIYTSYCSDQWRKRLNNQVITGYLQDWPFSRLRRFLPVLRQRWFRRLDLSDYDVVISSSGNGEAKFVLPKPEARRPETDDSRVTRPVHICYCHTPTHFYWRHYKQYLSSPGLRPRWLVRFALRALVKPLKKRDYSAAQSVDYFIANSTHIKHDIRQYYDRDATVIFPPVDTAAIENRIMEAAKQPRSGYVTLGRQTTFKKTDLIVQACTELEVVLTVIGNGPEHQRLKSLAGPTVTFKTDVSDEQLPVELASAEAFIFAAHDDFGIAPVEAMAAGTPVIAYQAGGALDYVKPGTTGVFFLEQNVKSIKTTIKKFDGSRYDERKITIFASLFSKEVFRKRIDDYIKSIM